MAVQGGLLAATIAQREEERLKQKAQTGNALPILAFLLAKLIAYTILGGILGLIGGAFTLSLTTQIILQFAVIIFMIGTALNILDIHPIFRYFVIQPPRFLTRLIRKQSKSKQLFAPALLGAFTVFIPCGTTQAMMALAIASGKPLYGAAILLAFVLGTSPVFFILGYFATKLGDVLQQRFMKYAALAIILLALFNLNNAIALTGSSWTAQTIAQNIFCAISYCDTKIVANPIETADIAITAQGYNPNNLTVKTGTKVTLHLTNKDGQGCEQAFTIPSLGIQKVVPMGQSGVVTFTAPNKPGTLRFMCSMGNYPGTINVI
jgi:sulfite exporter TauE/SafE